jgi:membrane protease YdiL (CAAX protease family)
MTGLILSLLVSIYGVFLLAKEYPKSFSPTLLSLQSNSEKNLTLGIISVLLLLFLNNQLLLIFLLLLFIQKNTFGSDKFIYNRNFIIKGICNWTQSFAKIWCIIFVFSTISYLMLIEFPVQDIVNKLKNENFENKVLIIISVLFIAPLTEEIVFRKFLYRSLKKYLGAGMSAMVSSLIFSLVHFSIFSFMVLFLLGLFFCYYYEKHKTICASVWIHFNFNLFSTILILIR